MKKGIPFLSFPLTPVSRLLLAALLYLALMGYLYSFSKYGLNVWDEGGFANGTLRTLNGQQAMVDFNPQGYLPARYLYASFFFKLFGIDIQSLRLSVILITPAMIFMVYASARKFMPAGFAFLAALFMLSAPGMYYNRFFPFFCVLNLYCLLQTMEKRRPFYLILLGSSILVSAFFKLEVAAFSTVIAVVMVSILLGKPEWKKDFLNHKTEATPTEAKAASRGFWIAVSLLGTALIAMFIYLMNRNFFELTIKMVVGAHSVWGNPFPQIFPFSGTLEQIGLHIMFDRLLFYLPIWVYGTTAVILLVRLLKFPAEVKVTELYLVAVLSFGICAYGLVISRAGFDNLLRTLPPFYILFCYLLFVTRKQLLRLSLFVSHPDNESAWLKKLPLNIATVFLPFLFFIEMNANHGFYAGTVGAIKQETTLVKMDRMEIFTNPSEAQWIKGVVEQIEKYSEKGDPIWILPLNPIFYFLTDRINPTAYDWILPGMLGEEEQYEVIEQLKANKPKVIIYVDIPIDSKEERRFSNYAPIIFDFISKNYAFSEFIGIFQIVLPKA